MSATENRKSKTLTVEVIQLHEAHPANLALVEGLVGMGFTDHDMGGKVRRALLVTPHYCYYGHLSGLMLGWQGSPERLPIALIKSQGGSASGFVEGAQVVLVGDTRVGRFTKRRARLADLIGQLFRDAPELKAVFDARLRT